MKATGVTGLEPVRRCPLCEKGELRTWRNRCHDRLHGLIPDRFAYARCRSCSLVFLATRVRERDAHLLYPGEYQPYRQGAPSPAAVPAPALPTRLLASGPLQRGAAALTRRLEGRYPDQLGDELRSAYTPPEPGRTLLDFGCGSSEFLDEMRPRGWQTFGADFMPEVVESVRREGHEGRVVDDAFWDGVPDASLSAVRLNHVLEHLYQPRAVLSEIRRSLAPGGVVHIAIPNPESVWSSVFRSRWFDLDCPRHVMLYPARLLTSLLHDLGFRRVRVVHQVLTTVIVRSWGYVLHDLGRIEHDQISVLVDDQVRARALRLPAKAVAVLGRSDRYHAFASG